MRMHPSGGIRINTNEQRLPVIGQHLDLEMRGLIESKDVIAVKAVIVGQHRLVDHLAELCTGHAAGGPAHQAAEKRAGHATDGQADRTGKGAESRTDTRTAHGAEAGFVPPVGAIPFGPFLSLAAIEYLFFSEQLHAVLGYARME